MRVDTPSILSLAVGALLSWAPPAMAGAAAPEATLPEPGAEAGSAFSGELSLGYDTFYIFRGEELFEEVSWRQVMLSMALSDSLSFTLTTWNATAAADNYIELDFLPTLTWDAGFAEFTAGFAHYNFLRGAFGGGEGMATEREANLSVAKSFGIFDTSLLAVYNFNRDAVYYEAGVGTSIGLSKFASLVPSVNVGYSSEYFGADGLSHVLLTLSLPLQLTETATLTPYLAGNIPLNMLDEIQDPELFGGVAFAVSF